ncbi:Trace amine-associated receptor 1 [Trichoplax sp. H2]|nr:Trace amine-associated receptor 1 [Trichoplax sp. H2]|eukprot:RDD37487.1 Trace amine-associated receptor 1 [Trichoplax sp. H2]
MHFYYNSTIEPSYLDEDDKNLSFTVYKYGACISSLTLVTNTIVITVILSKPNLRIISNAILLSSCLAALLYGLIIIGTALVSTYAVNPFKDIILYCVLGKTSELTALSIFNLHLTSLSLERFFSSIYPFRYRRLMSIRNSFAYILIIWLIPSCIIFLLALIASFANGGDCTAWMDIIAIDIFFSYIVLPIIFLTPPFIMFICYAIIVWKIFSMQRKISAASILIDSTPLSRSKLMQNWKAILQMFIVLGFYISAFYPFVICYIILIAAPNIDVSDATTISYLLIISYIAIHPIISVQFTAPVKDEIRKPLRRFYELFRSWLSNSALFRCCNEKTDDNGSRQLHVQTLDSRIISLF